MSLAAGAALGEAAAAWAVARRVAVGGRSVRYREAGHGPPLVLVHGLGVSADYWHRNAPALALGGLRVLAPDLPGFGRTPGPPGLSIAAQARALADWAAALRLGPAAWLGHSLGAQSVLQLAATSPGAVRALVLAAPTGGRRRRDHLHQALGLLRDAFREPAHLFPIVVRDYLRVGPLRYWRTWRDATRHDSIGLLPRVQAPVLVVVGSDDPVVSPEVLHLMLERLPDARCVEIAGGSHAVLYDAAPEFNRAVLAFLRTRLPAPA